MTSDIMKMFEEEIERETVFEDLSKASPDYVPERLVHRGEEQKKLRNIFDPCLRGGGRREVLITGPVGTGKTAMTSKLGKGLEETSEEEGLDLVFTHVNCRKSGTPWTIMRELAADLPVDVPKARFDPKDAVDCILDHLQEEDSRFIFALDDLGHHVRERGPGLLDSLVETLEKRGASERVGLVAVAHSRRFLDRVGDTARNVLGGRVLELGGYGGRELSDILRQRVEIAFKPGAVGDDAITLISDISSERGDARFALELLEVSGRIASDGEVEKVSPRHVRRAKAGILPEVRKGVLAGLRERDLLVLLAVSRRLRISCAAYLEPEDVEDSFRVVCEEQGAEKGGPEEVRASVERMHDLGLIELKPADETPPGRGRGIGISDAPSEAVENEVARILAGREVRATRDPDG